MWAVEFPESFLPAALHLAVSYQPSNIGDMRGLEGGMGVLFVVQVCLFMCMELSSLHLARVGQWASRRFRKSTAFPVLVMMLVLGEGRKQCRLL